MTRARSGRLPVLGVTAGDPNGIGPEVALRALLDAGVWRVCRPLLIGDAGVFEYYKKRFRIPLTLFPAARPPPYWGRDVVPVVEPPRRRAFRTAPGTSSRAAGSLAGRSL
ncbi:MAG TPA: hypothetical protein VI932_05175, partial [Bacteroidota bacterium]|nr:hypothetical protein [Bacteroidota bacterium]